MTVIVFDEFLLLGSQSIEIASICVKIKTTIVYRIKAAAIILQNKGMPVWQYSK